MSILLLLLLLNLKILLVTDDSTSSIYNKGWYPLFECIIKFGKKKLIKDEKVALLDIVFSNLKFYDNEFILHYRPQI